MGRIAELDTRLLTLAVLVGALRGRTEEGVNFVNAGSLAEERGIVVEEKSVTEAEDFNDLIRVTVHAGGERVAVAGTGIGPAQVPHLAEVWGQRFTLELARNVTVFRYSDVPGMIGRVGTVFGEHGINISSAAVGQQMKGVDAGGKGLAAMVVTTGEPVPEAVLGAIVALEGFVDGRSVTLA
jgi:D-3-phosphoglycerate dehydrogenase